MSYEWVFSYNTDVNQKHSLHGEEVIEHPLRPLVTVISEGRLGLRGLKGSSTGGSSTTCSTPPQLDPLASALDGSDPLTQFASGFIDPLSKIAAKDDDFIVDKDADLNTFEPWTSRRSAILGKFITAQKLSMVLASGEKVVVKPSASATVVEKVRTRLEQLDDLDDGVEKETLELTQQEYVSRIELMNHELVEAWNHDQRVRALKIVIQVAKMLGDVSVMQFYPSKFVLISDIFDVFGKLVFDRLRAKSNSSRPGSKASVALPENFTPDLVSESAKETCRNWFYKIASIRELIPRLYCEMAILKSYLFLSTKDISEAVERLTRMIRGIANPLVAIYARCYLCRVGLNLSKNRDFLKENFRDFLMCHRQFESRSVRAELSKQNVSPAVYQNLFLPALDFIVQAIAVQCSDGFLGEIIQRSATIGNPLIIYVIMRAFPEKVISNQALTFLKLFGDIKTSGIPHYQLLHSLGLCLKDTHVPCEKAREIQQMAWKLIEVLDVEFMSVCDVWANFIVTSLTFVEINTFLESIYQYLQRAERKEKYFTHIHSILSTIVIKLNEDEDLFAIDKFLPLLDLLGQDQLKIEVCKNIMERVSKSNTPIVSNPVITNALMYVCRTLHDSISAMTIADEKRQIANLISDFIRVLQFPRNDLEQQLLFYVDARGAFPNLDAVHVTLVEHACACAMAACRVVRGHHTRKTAAYVRACVAYCFITIPTVTCARTRMTLYLSTAQAALANQCLGQGDACLYAALKGANDLPTAIDGRSTEAFLVGFFGKVLSILLIVPDNPETGVMCLTRALIETVKNYPWERHSNAKILIYLKTIDMLHAAAQETYPYHINNVESNDSLYGWDPKFTAELNKIATALLEDILTHLKFLAEEKLFKDQSTLSLELFLRTVLCADLNQPQMASLALNLWNLSKKHGCMDVKLAQRIKEYLHRRPQHSVNYTTLLSKLQIKTEN